MWLFVRFHLLHGFNCNDSPIEQQESFWLHATSAQATMQIFNEFHFESCCFHLVTVSITSFHAVNVNRFNAKSSWTYAGIHIALYLISHALKLIGLWLRGKLIKVSSFHHNLLVSHPIHLAHTWAFILCTCSFGVLLCKKTEITWRKTLDVFSIMWTKTKTHKREMCLFRDEKSEQLPFDIGQRLGLQIYLWRAFWVFIFWKLVIVELMNSN